jgi:sulfite exporter TauE/SafE
VDPLSLSVTTGFGLGLASTLHCAGMCGGIASSLLIAGTGGPAPSTSRVLVLTHAGRITAYAAAGILIASIGTPIVGWLDRELAFRVVQWASAVALMWIGLSTAGLLPPLNGIDRLFQPVASMLAHVSAGMQGRTWSSFATGLAWGLMPCAMVYGALFMAMLTGSALLGGLVMLAFGIGTLPALLAATLGVRAFARAGQRPGLRLAAGLAIGAFGFLTVWLPHPSNGVICAPGAKTQLSWINFAP